MEYALSAAAGVLVIVGMVLNARLSEHMGSLQAACVNFGVGFSTMLAVFAVSGGFGCSGAGLPAPYLLSGGVMGALVVLGSNRFIPKISAVYATALMFVGQILTALVLDAVRFGFWSWVDVGGSVLVGAGIILNSYLESREKRDCELSA